MKALDVKSVTEARASQEQRAFVILERAMGQNQKQPSKHQVRQYMEGRQREHKPPPDAKQIRRELGWELIEAERKEQAGRR